MTTFRGAIRIGAGLSGADPALVDLDHLNSVATRTFEALRTLLVMPEAELREMVMDAFSDERHPSWFEGKAPDPLNWFESVLNRAKYWSTFKQARSRRLRLVEGGAQ